MELTYSIYDLKTLMKKTLMKKTLILIILLSWLSLGYSTTDHEFHKNNDSAYHIPVRVNISIENNVGDDPYKIKFGNGDEEFFDNTTCKNNELIADKGKMESCTFYKTMASWSKGTGIFSFKIYDGSLNDESYHKITLSTTSDGDCGYKGGKVKLELSTSGISPNKQNRYTACFMSQFQSDITFRITRGQFGVIYTELGTFNGV